MSSSGVIVCGLPAPSTTANRIGIRASKLQQHNHNSRSYSGFDVVYMDMDMGVGMDSHNHDNGLIICALASSSSPLSATTSTSIRDKKGSKRKRRHAEQNCPTSGNGNPVVRVVSPYFREKEEGQDDKSNAQVLLEKQRKTKPRRDNQGRSCELEIEGGEVLNAQPTGFVGISLYFKEDRDVSSTCAQDDGNCGGIEKGEQCVGGRNLHRGLSLDSAQEHADGKIKLENLGKQNDVEEKRMVGKVPGGTCDDDKIIASQYFVRKVSGCNTLKSVKMEYKKRKGKPTGFVRVSPYFQNDVVVSSTCSYDVAEKMVKASVEEQSEKDGVFCGMEKGEQCVGEWNSQRGQTSVSQRELADCKVKVEDVEKQNDLEEKRMIGKGPAGICDDNNRIVSHYFVRKVSGCGTLKRAKRGDIKRKGKPEDHLHKKIEVNVVCTDSLQNISPCPPPPGVDEFGDEKNESMEKKVEKKRKTKKRTACDEDEESETKTETSRKLKRKRKGKKRTHDDKHFQKEMGETEDSVFQPQNFDSPNVVFKVKNEATHKASDKKVLASASARVRDAGHLATTKKVCPYFDKDKTKGNPSYEGTEKASVYTELVQDISPCFPTPGVDDHGNRKSMNLEEETEKKVKRKRNRRKKITCHEDLELGTVKKVKRQRKDKERAPGEVHCQEVKHENGNSVQGPRYASSPCSKVQKKSEIEHGGGQSASAGLHDVANQVQRTTTKKVSPYFDKPLEKDGCDGRKGKSGVERPGRITCAELEEILSKYAYKCNSKMNNAVKEVNDSATEEQKRRKQWRKIAHGTLSAAEKVAEAYRRKAPDNTWVPPRSPYNLLQEDHAHDPWRVLVICMLLNMTTGPQVKNVLWELFSLCPNAEAAIAADPIRIQSVIQSLGLQRKRTVMIQRFSREYLSDTWTHVTQLHGIGKYAADAYAIFCTGMWHQVKPHDHMLNYYWKYLHRRVIEVSK